MAGAAWLVCAATAAHAAEPGSLFTDPQDGWFDVSDFLGKTYGFVPVIAPVTEPAVGYGATGALLFMDRDVDAGASVRPNLYVAGGMYTASESWAALGALSAYFLQGDLHVLGGGGYVSLNLKHYGLGEDPALSQNPVDYNLRGAVAGTSATMRIASTPLHAGAGVRFGKTQVELHGSVPGATAETTVVALRPLLQFDTRDNIFTPTRGLFGEAGLSASYQSAASWFELLDLTAIGYAPILLPELFLGARGAARFSFGDTPFYLRPFVVLRGAPAMRYQGEQTAELEVELRWQFWKRFSLVGFGGAGGAWTGLFGFDRSEAVFTGGTGFRYELARKYGMHMGADFAFGKDGFALYIQFGSAWSRL